MDKIVLIDGNSLLNRAFYATPVFTTQNGMPTNAIFGFTKLLFKILDDIKPEYIAVAFDMKSPTFRHKMYDGYKSTRKPMPDELGVQVEPLKNLLKAMKIAVCGVEGIEADDILGTLSKKFAAHSYIYTGDRDSYQLVDEHTDVCFTRKGVSDILHLSAENFKAEIGIEPSQVVDLKALMGDKSDNIPGVAGIGEKTALDLLEKYGSLDGIYEKIDEMKFAMRSKFENNREIAYLSYKLAKIDRDCEIDLELSDCAAPKKFDNNVREIFGELEFRSFLSLDIFDGAPSESVKAISYPEKIYCRSFAEIEGTIAQNSEFTVILEQNSAEIYAGEKEFSVALQTNLQDEAISYGDFVLLMQGVFSNPAHKVITHNYKDVLHRLEGLGVEAHCDFEDVALIKYLCDNSSAGFDLKALCAYYLYDYSFGAFALRQLCDSFFAKLESEGVLQLYRDIEKPLLLILYDMEREGVMVSAEQLNALTKKFVELADDYRMKIYKECDDQFNLNSPAKLAEILYTKFGLTEVKNKKTGKFSTSADILEKLVDKAPVVGDILKYRQYQKLVSTYCDGLRALIDKKTNLIHTTYHQTLTTTGRLSSSDPNLQNIPIREDEGRELRRMFVPREGNVFIDADYSQIELRLLAHFSGCKELVEAYNNGVDVHAVTASQVFGVSLDEVTPKMRREAKAVNFGIIYGISEFGLSKNLNIPISTAKEYIEKYFERYSAVKDYMNKNVEFAKEHGYVSTLTGRKRMIPELKSANFNLRSFGERAAMNMPLQGSSADIIKIAMINVCNALKKNGLKAKLILQVHDELVLEAPENEVEKASEILKYEMENAVKLNVPLTVELHTGKNWYDAK